MRTTNAIARTMTGTASQSESLPRPRPRQGRYAACSARRLIAHYRADIQATLFHGVNNGRMESLNTKVRLVARRAFGFHSAPALIALSELALSGLCPALPGRQPW